MASQGDLDHAIENTTMRGPAQTPEDRPLNTSQDQVHSHDQSFTWRAVLAGLSLGLLVNISNSYYGLRVGAGSQMSMVSGLLGYASFKVAGTSLSPEENVLVISVATATGCMPLTTGLIGAIPALEYLIGPDENGPLRKGLVDLIIWSIGLCFFGIIFAALLRETFIEKSQLPWPGPRATSHLISTLHHAPLGVQTPSPSSQIQIPQSSEHDNLFALGVEPQVTLRQTDNASWRKAAKFLVRGAVGSGIVVGFNIQLSARRIVLTLNPHSNSSQLFWTSSRFYTDYHYSGNLRQASGSGPSIYLPVSSAKA